jgi:UDP-glucose 4-epimerase
MKVLITGGLGYVGSQVSYDFLQNGHEVSIIDILKSNPFEKIKDAKYDQVDISDFDCLKSYFKQNRFDQIIHLAAKKSVIESIKKPQLYRGINIEGTRNLLELASVQDCKNFIFASSAAVYAESESGLVNEESELAPANPYGESKLESELILNGFISQGKINGCSLRLFNVSGEGETGLATTH